jgi:hypothetical protein
MLTSKSISLVLTESRVCAVHIWKYHPSSNTESSEGGRAHKETEIYPRIREDLPRLDNRKALLNSSQKRVTRAT